MLLNKIKKTLWLYAKCSSDLTNCCRGNIDAARFQPTDISLIDVNTGSQFLLRNRRRLPVFAYVAAYEALYIHL